METASPSGLAVVTGASSGIGLELAKIAASKGYDLIVAADEPQINDMAAYLHDFGVSVQSVQAELSTTEGVDRLLEDIEADGRSVALLMANAGRGLGKGFSTRILQRPGGLSIPISSAPFISCSRSAISCAAAGRGELC